MVNFARDPAPSSRERLLSCESHEGPQLAYAVCPHVMAGAPVVEVLPAARDKVGQILCGEDGLHRDVKQDGGPKIVCGGCARDRGWLK